MTDKEIKFYLKDRLKRLESIRNERELTTAELGDIACCKQTLAFIDSLQENPCDGCTNRKGCVTCENGELRETELSHSEVTKISDQEEPVSEDLEEVAEEYAYTNWQSDDYHDGAADGLPFDAIGHTKKTFIAGAKWQKQQDQETIELAEDHAMLAGMEKQQEKMIKDAVDGEVTHGKSLAIPSLGYFLDKNGLEFGDKVKLIIIKEG